MWLEVIVITTLYAITGSLLFTSGEKSGLGPPTMVPRSGILRTRVLFFGVRGSPEYRTAPSRLRRDIAGNSSRTSSWMPPVQHPDRRDSRKCQRKDSNDAYVEPST